MLVPLRQGEAGNTYATHNNAECQRRRKQGRKSEIIAPWVLHHLRLQRFLLELVSTVMKVQRIANTTQSARAVQPVTQQQTQRRVETKKQKT
jgi:hypothetical protein